MDWDKNLISKKDLLARYGISYGSLYRWKRKGLIPDEWFIKKATVTGQETFFPEELICERMERILSTKEDILLDELAAKLSGEEQTNRTVVIETAYGQHSYKLSDIRKITISGEGGRKDVTQKIMEILGADEA
ncbi:MAG: YhbD family protein [Acetatifactor sp.]|nr:YhbD family protein [Acetatifactor sp.]